MNKTNAPRVVAVIPARGGSKGIPKKNVKLLAGKPLIAYSIEAAKAASTVHRVIVSTDDPVIGQVSLEWGAEVVWRPADISGDIASSEAALLHVLDSIRTGEGVLPDLLVFLQCTSPFTAAEDIDGTVNALISQGAQTAVAMTPFHYFVWEQEPDGNIVGVNHDKSIRLLRQQRPPQYLETGAVYAMEICGFLERKHRFFGKTAMHVIPPERVLEIDEPEDFAIAEARLAAR
jgi:CMP-N-acetylneuraminic acid synthetase